MKDAVVEQMDAVAAGGAAFASMRTPIVLLKHDGGHMMALAHLHSRSFLMGKGAGAS